MPNQKVVTLAVAEPIWSNYNRRVQAWVQGAVTCRVCRQVKVCLCVDTSDGEYGPGEMCLDCVQAAFARFQEDP